MSTESTTKPTTTSQTCLILSRNSVYIANKASFLMQVNLKKCRKTPKPRITVSKFLLAVINLKLLLKAL